MYLNTGVPYMQVLWVMTHEYLEHVVKVLTGMTADHMTLLGSAGLVH